MEMNATIVINRPVDTGFAYVSNVSNDVHWRTGVTESRLRSDPPLDPGSIGYARAGDAANPESVSSWVHRQPHGVEIPGRSAPDRY